MIVECIIDMASFMIVYVIGVIAFADAFLSIEYILTLEGLIAPIPFDSESSSYNKYFKGYVLMWQKSFLVSLGEFDPNLEFYREQDWIVFLLCCIFNIIVLLNLLIAIISETFTKISDRQVANGYQEKSRQISMMQDQLLGQRKFKKDPNELAFIAKVINSEDIQESVIVDQIEELREDFNDFKQEMRDLLKQ